MYCEPYVAKFKGDIQFSDYVFIYKLVLTITIYNLTQNLIYLCNRDIVGTFVKEYLDLQLVQGTNPHAKSNNHPYLLIDRVYISILVRVGTGILLYK